MKPILFNTEMVKAILDGRKTQTRRVVKPRHKDAYGFNVCFNKATGAFAGVYDTDEEGAMFEHNTPAPYQKDDVIYVRETYCELPVKPDGTSSGVTTHIYYRADGDLRPKAWQGNWEPSIFMPKAAARIFLRVKSVSVEKLQSLLALDIYKEGLLYQGEGTIREIERRFIDLWDRTVTEDQYKWASNPWVWVIEFERISKEEAMRSNEP